MCVCVRVCACVDIVTDVVAVLYSKLVSCHQIFML